MLILAPLGLLLIAVGVALLSIPAGVIVFGIEFVVCGVLLDLASPDDVTEDGEP